MKRNEKSKYVAMGMAVMLIVSLLIQPAFAGLVPLISKNIKVSYGIDIYLNDEKLIPKDSKGNTVDVFMYNGTTYLPVRAISEALGEVVQWEGSTSSVYIGEHKSDKPAVMLGNLDYFDGTDFKNSNSLEDNLGKTHSNCLTATYGGNKNIYKINGKYSRISGVFFQIYEYRSRTYPTTLEIYGDNELLFTKEMKAGVEPANFDINLTGVKELKVNIRGYDPWNAALGNCGLYT